jgi:hypothetical protein
MKKLFFLCLAFLPLKLEGQRNNKLKKIPMVVESLFPTRQGEMVLLKAEGKDIYLPIWIGHAEALAISLRLAQKEPPRPLTHDLLEAFLKKLQVKIKYVLVEDLRNNVFIGRIFFIHQKRHLSMDARPSDSIVLALGTGAKIYVALKVLKKAGITRKEIEERLKKKEREGRRDLGESL